MTLPEADAARVVGKRPAPRLKVLFSCPVCAGVCERDAYRGPVTCFGGLEAPEPHGPVFMDPVGIV